MPYKHIIKGVVLLSFAGCASAPVPSQRVVSSQAAIRAAEEVGAAQVPSAALHLELARQQVERAQRLIKEGENVEANYLLLRSEADAELALALAREAPLRREAQEAITRAQTLQQQNVGASTTAPAGTATPGAVTPGATKPSTTTPVDRPQNNPQGGQSDKP